MKAELCIEIPPNTPTKSTYRNIKTPADPNSPVSLIIRPRDSDFTDAIIQAGVKVEPLTLTKDDTPATTDLETLLKDLK